MTGTPADCPSPEPAVDRRIALLAYGSRFALAAAFLMAALGKLTNGQEFADRLLLHSHLPHWLGVGVAAVLPWLELTCGLCLALGYAVREAALIVGLLLVSFLIYLLTFAGERPCDCFLFLPAVSRSLPRWAELVRNGMLLIGAALVVWKYPAEMPGENDRGNAAPDSVPPSPQIAP